MSPSPTPGTPEQIPGRWRALQWRTGRPWRESEPWPVLYLRCDDCGKVAPHTRETYLLYTDAEGKFRQAPPQYPCPLCGHAQLRAVDDEVGGSEHVHTCDQRRGWMYGWRRCRTVFAAPAEAALVYCPACGTDYPGAAAAA